MGSHLSQLHNPIAAICHAAQLLAAAGVVADDAAASAVVAPNVAQLAGPSWKFLWDHACVDEIRVTASASPGQRLWLPS